MIGEGINEYCPSCTKPNYTTPSVDGVIHTPIELVQAGQKLMRDRKNLMNENELLGCPEIESLYRWRNSTRDSTHIAQEDWQSLYQLFKYIKSRTAPKSTEAEYNCPPVCPKCHSCHRGECKSTDTEGDKDRISREVRHPKIIEKYKIKTIRHAANAAWNMINVALSCIESHKIQAFEALADAQDLTDLIVSQSGASTDIDAAIANEKGK